MNKLWIVALVLVVLTLVACGGEPTSAPEPKPQVEPSTQESPLPGADALESPLGMPNPASKYCEDQGYTLEMREEAGGTVGYCIFPDGSECEEWAYFRGECKAPSP